MTELQESILKVVAYFDIFQYPVTAQEIRSYMSEPCADERLLPILDALVTEEIIFKTNDFYTIQNNAALALQRLKDNTAAKKQLKLAKRIAGFLNWFPFIRGIAISGSLSKLVAKDDSDIDFFIITRENRLWISKLFFTTFTKFATIIGLEKWFCLNYVVDESCLEVPEKNIFTATEIITLIPLKGMPEFDRFFSANSWVYDFFPNHPARTSMIKENPHLFSKQLCEWLLNRCMADRTDTAIMQYFEKRWRRLIAENKFTKSGFRLGAMMTDKHFCRPYPEHFQQKILNKYAQNVQSVRRSLPVAI